MQGRRGKLQQFVAFFAGAAAATIVADAVLIRASGRPAVAAGLVHHVEFLVTLISLVGIAGVAGMQLSNGRELRPAALLVLGALAAALGYAIGLLLAPALGATASIVAIALAAAAVPAVAARWPGGRR